LELTSIETYSFLVTLAFKKISIISWIHRNRWLNNCVELAKHIVFIISHIYREDNQYVDDIATLKLQIQGSQIYLFKWINYVH
jgi:hypothetical protein